MSDAPKSARGDDVDPEDDEEEDEEDFNSAGDLHLLSSILFHNFGPKWLLRSSPMNLNAFFYLDDDEDDDEDDDDDDDGDDDDEEDDDEEELSKLLSKFTKI